MISDNPVSIYSRFCTIFDSFSQIIFSIGQENVALMSVNGYSDGFYHFYKFRSPTTKALWATHSLTHYFTKIEKNSRLFQDNEAWKR